MDIAISPWSSDVFVLLSASKVRVTSCRLGDQVLRNRRAEYGQCTLQIHKHSSERGASLSSRSEPLLPLFMLLNSFRSSCQRASSSLPRRLGRVSTFRPSLIPVRHLNITPEPLRMAAKPGLFEDATPDIVKNNKGLHMLTMSTPNGQKVQILLEELKDLYGTKWSYTLLHIMTNVQKEDWFLRLDP